MAKVDVASELREYILVDGMGVWDGRGDMISLGSVVSVAAESELSGSSSGTSGIGLSDSVKPLVLGVLESMLNEGLIYPSELAEAQSGEFEATTMNISHSEVLDLISRRWPGDIKGSWPDFYDLPEFRLTPKGIHAALLLPREEEPGNVADDQH